MFSHQQAGAMQPRLDRLAHGARRQRDLVAP
jgi:hypothetical protein